MTPETTTTQTTVRNIKVVNKKILDEDTGSLIYQVAKQNYWHDRPSILIGRDGMNYIPLRWAEVDGEVIVKVCGVSEIVRHGRDSQGHCRFKQLNSNYLQYDGLSVLGMVKLAEHLAQFEIKTWSDHSAEALIVRKQRTHNEKVRVLRRKIKSIQEEIATLEAEFAAE